MTDTQPPFQHSQSAHCESGVMSALLRNAGLPVSEAMVFGLSGAIIFAYLPMIKLGGLPLISYRMPPGMIVRGTARRLGVGMKTRRFRDPAKSLDALREHLAGNRLVGLQTSIFWLPYFPDEMRFHFNAHNLLVYGEQDNEFLVSDPVFDQPFRISPDDLTKARFAKGALAPKGLEYYPATVPDTIDFAPRIRASIGRSAKLMLHSPVPLAGVRGIRHVSKLVRKTGKNDPVRGKLLIGHMVRMQEEIGTGGGGFRFLYAAFLQEAGKLLGDNDLLAISSQFTDAGDEWRRYALYVAKMIKGRMALDFDQLADQLLTVADMEEKTWRELLALVK